MTRAAIPLPLAVMALFGCMTPPPASPPVERTRPADTITTITITRAAEPPAKATRPVMICLATGQNVRVHVSPAGDTLVGPRRVPLVEIGPLLGFVGEYAAAKGWFVHDQTITFGQRTFSKAGPPAARDCHSIRIVGDYDGVNLFADVDATAPLRVIYVPVQPGLFQVYRA